MSDQIRADYEQLDQVASRFAQQAEAIQGMLDQLLGSMEPLENGDWIGRGSDAFFSEMNGEVLPACRRLLAALNDAGQTTRAIVDKMRQAEDEAANPFRTTR